jgi:glycosyltransferase involved in cell wall biosynthesis
MKHTPIAVIVPAYNEEMVIVETLENLLRDARAGEFEVTVVCNGCHDHTAEVTRQAFDNVNVIELSEASKTAAINAGLRSARSSKINDSDCAGSVKAFYRIWARHPYVSNGKFAAAFAISREAMGRIGDLPEIIADDTYLMRMIPSDRVAVVDSVHFRVNVPKDFKTLVRVRSRIHRGNRQLEQYAPRRTSAVTANNRDFVRSIGRQPSLWRDIPVYLAATAASRLLAMKKTSGWERDLTTRQAATE